ncbi:unnamed protein product [Prunus armeniaca]
MASFSSIDLPSIHHIISIHLEHDNYRTWLAQIVHAFHSRHLLGFVDGTSSCRPPTILDPKAKADESTFSFLLPNPKNDDWVHKYHLVISLSHQRDLLCTTRGDSSITNFLDCINSTADNLALAGAHVADSNLLVVVTNNVGPPYENIVAVAQACEKPISMPDLKALLLSTNRRLLSSSSLAMSSSAMAIVASRGGRCGFVGCGHDCCNSSPS